MKRFILLTLAVAGATIVAKKSLGNPMPAGVRMASVEGREYEVFRRGGDTYEVVSRDDPGVFVIFGQKGEIDARGSDAALATVRADMQRFPSGLFS